MSNFALSSKSAQDGIAVMMPRGYINDIAAARLEQLSEQFLNQGSKKLIVNFTEVQFINTIGLSVFLGIVQKALGIPTSMFTCIFALARTVGWMTQWEEMITDPEYKIGRPRQLYVGAAKRDVAPLAKR